LPFDETKGNYKKEGHEKMTDTGIQGTLSKASASLLKRVGKTHKEKGDIRTGTL